MIGWVVVMLLLIMGCENEGNQDTHLYKRAIHVEKQVGDSGNYEQIRKVQEGKEVKRLKDALDQSEWQKEKIQMNRPPNYQFIFAFKNTQITDDPVQYKVWITPDHRQLEVVSGDSAYTKLPIEQSATVFEVLTGEKLEQ